MKAVLAAVGLYLTSFAMAPPALAQDAGISVRAIRVLAIDVEATAKFYESAFGMSEIRRPVDTATFKEIVVNSGSTVAAARAAASAPIVIATRADKTEKPVSMAALILDVPDMDKAIAAVVAAGGKGGKVNTAVGGQVYAMVADNEGNPIELLLRR